MLGHVDAPGGADRAGGLDVMRIASRLRQVHAVVAQDVRDIGFADADADLVVGAIEEVGQRPAAALRRSPERRPSGAQALWCERFDQAGTIRREQLTGALSRRKASGANIELKNAGFAWLRNSVMTDEVAVTAKPHNLLLDRA